MTQRIIVKSPSSVRVVGAGPVGPAGLPGVGTPGIQGLQGPPGIERFILPYGNIGELSVTEGKLFIPVSQPCSLERIRARVSSPPVGGNIVIDFMINGVSAWINEADRPTILEGEYETGSVTNMSLTQLQNNDMLGPMNIVSVGQTSPGSDLLVFVELIIA